MSGIGFQIFGFVASVVSTLAVTQSIYSLLRDAMPSVRMQALEVVLSETESLLRSALEEGTIDYGHYDKYLRSQLWGAKVCADECRAQVYTIKNRWQELVHLWGGLSGSIAAVIDDLCDLRGHIAVSSSRGRQRLAMLGQTAHPVLEKFAQRDVLSSIILPDPPVDVACTLKPCAIDDMTTVPLVTATSHGEPILALSSSSIPHPVAEQPTCSPSADSRSHAMPPLAFHSKLKEKASFGARRIDRVVLRRSSKNSSIDSAQSAREERQCFSSPFRIFSGILHRPSAPTVPTATASSNSLPPSALSEKGSCLQTAHWEEKGYVTLQVKLPV